MNVTVPDLKAFLEARDIRGFLIAYEDFTQRGQHPVELSIVTQRIFPAVLRELLENSRLTSEHTVHLWRLVRTGRLLIVDNDLLEGINERLDWAWMEVEGADAAKPEKLLTFSEEPRSSGMGRCPAQPEVRGRQGSNVLPMHRIVMTSAFSMGPIQLSDTLAFKKNVCFSSQEREFLKAIRQFFPSLHAYPNVPLRNFIEVDGFITRLSERHRSYSWAAQVDVLLCTDDEDPVAGIELDSVHHDAEGARERDQLKDELFAMAGISLVRIRADDTANVRAEDFYDLLVAESEVLDKLRPRRLRPRRTHDMLVPAEVHRTF